MLCSEVISNLKKRYDYDDKIINALNSIIPKLINYYKEEYKDLIISALYSCKIICCNSNETLSKVLKMRDEEYISFTSDIDLKKAESVYSPGIKLKYNEEKNIYEIKDIDRMIVISHTYNLDSLKGIEVLTHAIVHLIKGFSAEFVIDENIVTVRNGIAYEKCKIIYNNGNIYLEPIEIYGHALTEGLTIYDTEKIVSLVCNDAYKCYDFDSIYTIAYILKEKYKKHKEFNDYEIKGETEEFFKKYGQITAESIGRESDEIVDLENQMRLSYTKDDKEMFKNLINDKLSSEIYDVLISFYENKQVIKTN